MFCIHCGKSLENQGNFCPFCGGSLNPIKSDSTTAAVLPASNNATASDRVQGLVGTGDKRKFKRNLTITHWMNLAWPTWFGLTLIIWGLQFESAVFELSCSAVSLFLFRKTWRYY